jgi:hypothetical protein
MLGEPMNRPRFTVLQAMAVVLAVGLGLAALRNADALWAGATFTLAVAMLAAAPVGAVARRGRARASWAGCAAFGWTALLVAQLPPRDVGVMGFGPIPRPTLPIEWGLERLQPYLRPLPPGTSGMAAVGLLTPYEQVGHALGILLAGLVGAVLGRLLAVDEGRPGR